VTPTEIACDGCNGCTDAVGPLALILQDPPSVWLCRACWQREMTWRGNHNRLHPKRTPYPVLEWPKGKT
jgi:hypothetical protein